MKLYYAPGACSMAAHIVLNETGLPYEAVKVDLMTKTYTGGESFMAVNGKGMVPTLELDDGRRLTEVPAIVQYLADQNPQMRLAPPNGTFERYQQQEWLNFVASELHKQFAPLFNPTLPAEWRQMAIDKLSNRFDWLNKQLAGKSYLAGEQFTVADAYMFAILNWTRLLKFDLGPWPVLQEYIARVAARPSVTQTMKSEGLLK